jgi:CheY-like chemotaxis protein
MRGRFVRTLVVDDNADMRFLVRTLLGVSGSTIEIVGEAEDGPDAVAQCHDQHPDVVVLDVQLPSGSGLDFVEGLRAADPPPEIVLFSAYLSDQTILRATELGLSWLSKDELRRLPSAILEAGS